ncbi:MAG: type III-A CRISPR-associated protein Cas10/Csm1 [Patescibacteria group bacterium]|nr:type III-A CRISPR-associated protein Cas10/Csm1 [Patescibacteria group bacterium]
MQKYLPSILLATLFHDLGKFFQRTKYFEADGKNHSEISSLFVGIIEEIEKKKDTDKLKKNIRIIDKEIDFELVKRLILDHHKKKEEIEGDEEYLKIFRIVKKADWLSASRERETNITSDKPPELVNQRDIFEFLFLDQKKESTQPRHYHKISPLYLFEKEWFFPSLVEKQSESENIRLYREMISKENLGWLLKGIFGKEMTFLNFLYAFDEILYFLLTTIPEDRRDVFQLNSLYDHLKLTTVFAHCLCFDDQKLYLLKFDFVGIQKFIFNIRVKKASQMLRGRSFFIQFMTELVNYLIVKEFDLIPQNNLSSFGGNSVFVIPKIDNIKSNLEAFFLKINKFLIKKLGVYLRYDIKEVSLEDDFFDFKRLKIRPTLNRQVLFEISQLNDQIPKEINLEELGQCDICQVYGKKNVIPEFEITVCSDCLFILTLSQKIRRGDYFSLDTEKLIDDFKNFVDEVHLNLFFSRTESGSLSNRYFFFKPLENLRDQLTQGKPFFFNYPSKTIFYKINQPQQEGRYLSFEEIAQKSSGAKLLLYLKADVDDMSSILERGFSFREAKSKEFTEDKRNRKYTKITDKLHFSRRINLFFQNYLPLLIEKKYQESLYLVFSGGDDLFLVGAWDKALNFLFEMKGEFDEFVCKNPYLHFSSGAVIAKADTPVYLIVDQVEEKLMQAKNQGKNKFSFLFSTEAYDVFFKIYQLGKLIGKTETISSSFIYKIFKLADYIRNPNMNYNMANSFYKMIYLFKRNLRLIDKHKSSIEAKNQESHNEIVNLFDKFFEDFLSKRFEEESFIFLRDNLKSVTNLALLYRREQ